MSHPAAIGRLELRQLLIISAQAICWYRFAARDGRNERRRPHPRGAIVHPNAMRQRSRASATYEPWRYSKAASCQARIAPAGCWISRSAGFFSQYAIGRARGHGYATRSSRNSEADVDAERFPRIRLLEDPLAEVAGEEQAVGRAEPSAARNRSSAIRTSCASSTTAKSNGGSVPARRRPGDRA